MGNNNKILITGNGFDLYCNLKTKFSDFANYLKEEKEDEYIKFSQFFNLDEKEEWNEIEEKIYIKWKSEENNIELNKKITEFEEELKHYLKTKIDVKKCDKSKFNIIEQKNPDKIVSFNYTRTIEENLGKDVVHLHGVIGDPSYDEKICIGYDIGSNKFSDTRIPYNYDNDIEGYLQQEKNKKDFCLDKSIRLNTFDKKGDQSYKYSILARRKTFDTYATLIEEGAEVVIFGHSLGDSDKLLVEALKRTNTKIEIYSYWEDDKKRKEIYNDLKNKIKEFELFNSRDIGVINI